MSISKNTAVITVLGKDRVGIIAGISNLLADSVSLHEIYSKFFR